MEIEKAAGSNLEELLKEAVGGKDPVVDVELHPGKVVDNNDPKKMGRCRVRVFGIYGDSIPDEDLPWAFPEGSFAGSKVGSLVVPPVDAIVNVRFEGGDMYMPFYSTKVQTAKNLKDMKSNPLGGYPNTIVFFETDEGDWLKMDRKSGSVEFQHRSGATIEISKSGHITISNANTENGGLDLLAKGDVGIQAGGDIMLNAGGKVKLVSPSGLSNAWYPNTIPVCPFSGAPHGGVGGTLTGLTGSK